MSENTIQQPEQSPDAKKQNRTMLVVVVCVAVAFIALIALNMK
jgi:hypothetical protein